MEGTCQSDGYCSFPDPACPSGQRYGEHAGGGKASACVGAEPDAEATSADTAAQTSATTTGLTTSPSEGAVEDGDTGAMESDSTTSEIDDSTAGDTGGAIVCTFSEHFDGPTLDAAVWSSFSYGGALLAVQNGRLLVALVSAVENAAGIEREVGDLNGKSVTWVIGSGTNPLSLAEQRLSLSHGGTELRMTVTQGTLHVTTYDGSTQTLATTPINVSVDDHLRFAHLGGVLHAQRSSGGIRWESVWQGPSPIALEAVTLRTRAGSWNTVFNPGMPSFDSIEICTTE